MWYLHNLAFAICCIFRAKILKIRIEQAKNAFAFLSFSAYNDTNTQFM